MKFLNGKVSNLNLKVELDGHGNYDTFQIDGKQVVISSSESRGTEIWEGDNLAVAGFWLPIDASRENLALVVVAYQNLETGISHLPPRPARFVRNGIYWLAVAILWVVTSHWFFDLSPTLVIGGAIIALIPILYYALRARTAGHYRRRFLDYLANLEEEDAGGTEGKEALQFLESLDEPTVAVTGWGWVGRVFWGIWLLGSLIPVAAGLVPEPRNDYALYGVLFVWLSVTIIWGTYLGIRPEHLPDLE